MDFYLFYNYRATLIHLLEILIHKLVFSSMLAGYLKLVQGVRPWNWAIRVIIVSVCSDILKSGGLICECTGSMTHPGSQSATIGALLK